jgi:hypothetical protein
MGKLYALGLLQVVLEPGDMEGVEDQPEMAVVQPDFGVFEDKAYVEKAVADLNAKDGQPEGQERFRVVELEAKEPPVEERHCKRCGSTLSRLLGWCSDITCPFNRRKQDETWTEG